MYCNYHVRAYAYVWCYVIPYLDSAFLQWSDLAWIDKTFLSPSSLPWVDTTLWSSCSDVGWLSYRLRVAFLASNDRGGKA